MLNSNGLLRSLNQTMLKLNYSTAAVGAQHKKMVFSGIQPTSIPHIGNYFGAIKSWVELQDESSSSGASGLSPVEALKQSYRLKKGLDKSKSFDMSSFLNQEKPLIVSIVDLHAITLPKSSIILNDFIYKCAATLIACGIDPSRTILYQQSQVPYHGQLSWILGCKVTMPQLGRMHQFKFKSDGLAEVPLGLYTYPVLQAADILLFKATHVPVGEDQLQHLELCREIALKFNNFYNVKYFPLPTAIETSLTRLKSLRDPAKKMSKSDADQNSRIELTDPAELIRKKIKKAVTDAKGSITYDPEKRPGVATLIDIDAACTGRDPDEIVEYCLLNALDTGLYKQEVANLLIKHVEPIQRKYLELINDRAYLRKVLDEGADRANEIASKNFKEITKIIGSS